MSLDLNMGYYHIGLTPYASSLCIVVLPWGKYEYLGYLINKKGVRPTMKKVEAITNIYTPKTRKQLRSFIRMVNYLDICGHKGHT